MEQIIFFIFGAIVGSFLNVIICRYNTGESVISGRSRCFSCGKKLRWHELIPVFSFIIQKGRCKDCGSKISWQYPAVEILTGLIFLLIFNFSSYGVSAIGGQFSLFYLLVIFSILIIIAVYDLRHKIIPNAFVYSFDILAFLSLFGNLKLEIRNLIDWVGFFAGILFFLFFALFWLVSRGKWMGLADAKLALGIGWLLGLTKGFWALLLSFWAGAVVGIFLLILFRKRYNMKSEMPFAPFLAFGATIAFLFL